MQPHKFSKNEDALYSPKSEVNGQTEPYGHFVTACEVFIHVWGRIYKTT